MGQVIPTYEDPFKQYLQSYTLVKTLSQHHILVYENPETNQTFQIKRLVFDEEKDSQKYFQIHQRRLLIKSPYLTRLIRHNISRIVAVDRCCREVFQHSAIWEYCSQNLGHEIQMRKTQNRILPGDEFDKIFGDCIQALAQLEENKLVHRKLNEEAICLDMKGNVKIIDPLRFVTSQIDMPKKNQDSTYLLPKECDFLKEPEMFQEYIKDNVLSLGIVLLKLALLTNFTSCYKSQNQNIDPQKVHTNLQKVSKIYGQRVKSILSRMLAQKQKDRPSFRELRDILQQNGNQSCQKQNKNTQNYLRNSPQVFAYSQASNQQRKGNIQNAFPFPLANHNENTYFVRPRMPIDTRAQRICVNNQPMVITNNQPVMITNFGNYHQHRLYPQPNNFQVKQIMYPQKVNRRISKNGYLFANPNQCGQKPVHIPIRREGQRQILENQIEMTESHHVQQFIYSINQSYNPKYQSALPIIESNYTAQNEEQDTQNKYKLVTEHYQGGRYEGQQLRGMRHGRGKFYYREGGMYDGLWEQGKMNGFGSLYYDSGKLAYQGNWKNDCFEGKGILFNQSPQKLQKEFDYRNFDGVGECWEYFEGSFKDDGKQNKGKFLLSNGECFTGNFRKDKIDGMGEFVCRSGRVVRGNGKRTS